MSGEEPEVASTALPWREVLAHRLAAVCLGLNVIGTTVGVAMTTGGTRARLAVGGILVLGLHAGALSRRGSLELRSWLLVSGLGIVALTGFVSVGFLGAPAMAAMLAMLVAGLLLGARALVGVAVVAALGATAIALAMTSGELPPPHVEDVAMTNLRAWGRSAGVGLMMAAVAGGLVTWVVRRLEEALASERNEEVKRRSAEVARTEAEQLAIDAQKMELVGRLAAGLAHDFNNHLTVIGLSSVQLAREGLTAEERRAASHTVSAAVRSAGDLARQLMVLGRGAPRSVEHLALRDVVEAVKPSIERTLPSDVTLRIEHAGEATVRADGVQLRQALLNFVVNARDAMPDGGKLVVRTRVEVLDAPIVGSRGTIAAGRWSILEVEDDGTGIDEATRERVFEPFFTTKPVDRGTGLGLATVSLIAAAAGGHVALDSEVGRGTSVSLWLPAAAASAPPPPRATPIATPARVLAGRTILLVEDEPLVLQAATRVLEEAGGQVITAVHGTAALERLAEGGAVFDLLCTDVVMPGAPVRDVIARFRELHPRRPVLACSGYVGEELVRRGVEEGKVTFLEKPYTPEALVAAIAGLLAEPDPG